MFYVDLDYLKKVGLYYDGTLKKVSVRKSSYRYPTLSCRLDGDELVFVLSYFISDDYNKQQIEFTLADWQEFGKEGEKLETLRKSRFFDYFTITNSLVLEVYKSRLKGRKAWKKRVWSLPFRESKVLEAFGIEKMRKEVAGASSSLNIEKISELDEIMKRCIAKAAKDFSYMPFDVYFDCYKKKLALLRKVEGNEVSLPLRTNRDKVFKEFAKQVVLLQKNDR